jgi:hypothetical protein
MIQEMHRLAILMAASWMARAQTMPEDAARVLELARVKILKTSRNLPRYTCQETIEREYFGLPKKSAKSPAKDNDACPSDASGLIRIATDRVRLEVAVSDGSEIHAWPGASKFDSRSLEQMVTGGPLSTGAFGTQLSGVFDNAGAHFEFAGEATAEGRRVFRYRYNVPQSASHYQVKLTGGTWWNTAYSGEFEISVDAGDLEKLASDTGSLPVDSGFCRAKTAVDYHYERVGGGGFLIPRVARLTTLHPDGSSTLSVTTFSACHEYQAESTIRFDEADAPDAASAKSAAAAANPLPGWTPVVVKLATPIDTETAAAGDVVWATISQATIDGKTKSGPAGLRLHGRVLVVSHALEDPQGFVIEVAFDRWERNGATGPFGAILLEGAAHVAGAAATLRPLENGGLMMLHTKAAKLIVPAGLEMKWMTLTAPK